MCELEIGLIESETEDYGVPSPTTDIASKVYLVAESFVAESTT